MASYNDAKLHAVRVNETHGQIFVDDLVIEFDHVIPENIISLAQSAAGDIYYGGYNIYKVQSLSSSTKQLTFPVRANLSRSVDLKEMTILRDNDTLILHASNNGSSVNPPKGV